MTLIHVCGWSRLIGGCVSFTENCIKDQENFKSEFAKQLNCKVGGQQQFNKTDLEKLKIENKKLQRKIDSCRYNKNKIDTLELEIKLLRFLVIFLDFQHFDKIIQYSRPEFKRNITLSYFRERIGKVDMQNIQDLIFIRNQ